jgi:aryl-alcohol dehydrogenase-like predicted oxidoreductase
MQYRQLGNSGLKVSAISIGSWLTYGNVVDDATAFACLDEAFTAGVNFVDTADVYNQGEAERSLGRWLRTVTRRHVVLATKAFFPMSDHWMDRGLSARHLHNALADSLERLQTDYIDLYQCHRYDPDTPLEETCFTMHLFIQRGHIRHWGVSQWSADEIRRAVQVCEANGWQKPISNQPIYNMLNRGLETEVMGTCASLGLGLVVYSPLAQGVLSGKYAPNTLPPDSRAGNAHTQQWFSWKRLNDNTYALLEALRPLAASVGLSLPQFALAWCLRRPEVSSAIIGASRPQQVAENLRAATTPWPTELEPQVQALLQRYAPPEA